ncbi:glycosyltransferase family 2 protein [Plantibacter flavus]|uniref:glycosyltransferase family A protein n=1 Tax=Plantibacter flavus TaxID=150123 RepID=UPI003F13E574
MASDQSRSAPSPKQGGGALRRARKRAKHFVARLDTFSLGLFQQRRRRSLLGTGEVVVSLTSYGVRTQAVHTTIESIGRGRVRPRRIILWLDDPSAMDTLSPELRSLQARGLEIALSDNLGPHTKYWPYVASLGEHTVPLVTADDDIIYPRGWLEELLSAHHARPGLIYCYWARVVQQDASGDFTPYESWPSATSTVPSPANFALGVSGVLYPPVMLNALLAAGRAFEAVTPKADDIWLHAVALRGGIPVAQVHEKAVHFLTVPGTQVISLRSDNVAGTGNDDAIARVYSAADRTALADYTSSVTRDGR